MTIEEIFSKLISHMEQGVQYHQTLAKAYDFIGLWGFSKCQLYHQFEELQGKQQLQHYYAAHYFKLIQTENLNTPEIIPANWYKYTTQDVDANTKKNAVKDLMTKWVAWERSTKEFYQNMRRELDALNELDAAQRLDKYICDVSHELHNVEKMIIKLETIGYDLITIEEWSDHLNKKYKKKLGW